MALIRPVFTFAWTRLARSPHLVASLLAMGGFALMIVTTGFGPSSVQLTSPYLVVQVIGLLTLLAIFVLTAFTVHAALGDVEHGARELLFATPLTPTAWFAGRWLTVVTAAFTTLVGAGVVLGTAPHLVPLDPARVGTTSVAGIAWGLLVIGLPNIILISALLFGAATLSGSTLVTAVSGIGIWALFWVTALLVDSPLLAGAAPASADALARAAILDPFGLSAFFEQTRYWTPAERNRDLPELGGRLILNRLLWLGIATAILVGAARRFRQVALGGAPGRARRHARLDVRPEQADVPALLSHGASHRLGAVATLVQLTRYELRLVLRNWAFIALLVMWILVAGIEINSEITAGEYGARLLPTTAIVVDRLLAPLALFGALVLIYCSGEIVWRDCVRRMDGLTDATPVPALARIGSQLAAIVALPLALLIVGLLTGVGIQLAYRFPDWQPMVLVAMLWYAGLPLVLLGVGIFTLQVTVPNRWVAMLGGIVLALAGAGELPGVTHPMLQFAAFPLAGYSDFDGFGAAPRPFLAFAAWWGSVSCALLVVAWALRHHGTDRGLRQRLAGAWVALGVAGRRTAIVVLLATVISGTWLAAGLARTTRFPDRAAALAWRADYELTYRRFHGRPQPISATLAVVAELEPTARRATISGTMTLVNRTTAPIDTILVGSPADAVGAELSATPAATVVVDSARRVVLVVPEVPLGPGDTLTLRYRHALDRGGVHAKVPPRDVTSNGTVLMHGQLVPSIGYRPQQEVADPTERAMVGLTGAPTPYPTASAASTSDARAGWVQLDATIATDPDQVALAVGDLVAQWDSAGRRWFRSRTTRPVTPVTAIVSARYERHVATAHGTTVEVWHLPTHGINREQIAEAALAAVAELTPRFGALPDTVLRIVELPRWSGFGAFALTGLVLFPEHRGFMLDSRPGRVDLVLRRVAHEVAHQWWGHRVSPPVAEGSLLLVESLAKDAEQLTVRRVHGEHGVDPILAYDEDRYLRGRAGAGEDEPPLERMTDESWLDYGKGSLMMHALRATLGDARVDAALQSILRQHAGPDGAATAIDLRDALLAEATSPSDTAIVQEWFLGRAVWDVAVTDITPAANGWQVTLRATRQHDATTTASPAPTDVVLERRDAEGRTQWRGQATLRAGTVTVPRARAAASIIVDPERRLLDRDRSNNHKDLISP
jgi:ABC-2 type transport system permease protein